MKKDNIEGFPGYYISKRGRVFSRRIRGKGYNLSKEWKELKTRVKKSNGRIHINLCREGYKPITENISRLVALTWIPNPNGYKEVCHKDNNVANNHYKNLYWGTHKMNMIQASNDGRLWDNKYPKELRLSIYKLYKMALSKVYLCECFSMVPRQLIYNITTGRDPIIRKLIKDPKK